MHAMPIAAFSTAALLTVMLAPAGAQSFDCHKATTAVEKMICADPGLSALDEEMAEAYTSATAFHGADFVGQAAWLKAVRNQCATLACLTDAYRARITYLDSITPMPKADGFYYEEIETFRPGVYEAIVDSKVYFDIDETADSGRRIKRGTRIHVYSAGHDATREPSTDWIALGGDCNGAILPWSELGWAGALMKDFKRVADVAAPIYKDGVVSNCAAGTRAPR